MLQECTNEILKWSKNECELLMDNAGLLVGLEMATMLANLLMQHKHFTLLSAQELWPKSRHFFLALSRLLLQMPIASVDLLHPASNDQDYPGPLKSELLGTGTTRQLWGFIVAKCLHG